jgi:hypothetical protein
MDLNISLIKKIENVLEMSGKFDKICSSILSGDNVINSERIQHIRELTSLYMLTRAEHGGILILNDKMKKEISTSNTNLSDKLINKLYDLSTFTSILENINNLVSNMDFEFKKIALLYPKFINNQQSHLILFVDKDDKKNKFINMIEDVKKLKPEINFHVIECDKDKKKIDCSKIVGMKLTISIKKLATMYLVNGTNIVELDLDKINVCEELVKMLE